ncbi:MAG TPA: Uma2 family endonuclease [Chloroflexota bacterium]|nr:Uma2 family endonuclease [Chloroflexota bacterium]
MGEGTGGGYKFTVDDLQRMPYVEGARYELIDGELYVSTAPHYMHQYVCSRLITALNDWSRTAVEGEATGGPGLVFDRANAVIPDVIWVRQSRFAQVHGGDGRLHQAPDLVIEVLSPGTINTARDRELKLGLYSLRQVPEYWIVDWQGCQVEVYRRAGDALAAITTLTESGVLTSPLLPGFALPLARLFDPLS